MKAAQKPDYSRSNLGAPVAANDKRKRRLVRPALAVEYEDPAEVDYWSPQSFWHRAENGVYED